MCRRRSSTSSSGNGWGGELGRALADEYPGLAILHISDLPRQEDEARGLLDADTQLLGKPFEWPDPELPLKAVVAAAAHAAVA